MQATLRAGRFPNTATTRAMPMSLARFWLVCLFFLLWACIIAVRLFMLQVVHHSDYMERAVKQQQRTFEVAPHRGILYDRNLRELAMTVKVDSIYAVPSEIDDKKAAAHALAAIVHTNPDDSFTTESAIEDRLENGRSFAWVARRVTPETSAKLHALDQKGLYFHKEFQRFYPNSETAAQVLGYVGLDDNGLGGLEQKYDKQLHGTSGRMFTALDARRRVLGSVAHEPDPGQNMVLTIDQNIQFMAEQALDHAMERTGADDGTVVVQDVHTGQILALAIRPSFDPNHFRHTSPKLLKNHAVSDVYEPGSVFKLVAYSAALDQNLVKPDDMVDCQGGAITIAGRVIHDNQGEHMGLVTVHKALEESSDVGAIKMALKVGQDRFYKYIRDYGFGSRTGVELPGETRGLLNSPKNWSGSSIGSIAIGQEVGVTPLQLVSMVSTIANGGTYLPPRVLMPGQMDSNGQKQTLVATPFRAGEELPNPLPQGAHRVISEMASAQMRKMMEGVVLYGSGKPAQLNGYSSGGKTGTAQKIDPQTHKYSKTMHIASFAGIAPVNNPAIAIAVVIDNPKKGPSYYGTAVSAPVFAEVAQQVLEYLRIPHDIEVRPAKSLAKKEAPMPEDDGAGDQNAANQLFAAVNDLPADDPLRAPVQAGDQAQSVASTFTASAKMAPPNNTIRPAQAAASPAAKPVAVVQSASVQQKTAQVAVKDGPKITVPPLVGMPMRKVIETAASSGIELQIVGDGLVRAQAPAPGTQISPGTKVVVRCGH